MKFVILCDEKPQKCEGCPFYGDVPVRTAKNALDIRSACTLGAESNAKCPLSEVNTIFDSALPAAEKKTPTTFCSHCLKETEYTIAPKQARETRNGVEYAYTRQEARCAECDTPVSASIIDEMNRAAQEDAYHRAAQDKEVAE